jgi:serine/threonine protein kinase
VKEGDEKSVVFSLGLMIFSILSGEIPFQSFDGIQGGEMIMKGKRPEIERISSEFEDWIPVIERCWNSERKRKKEEERRRKEEEEKIEVPSSTSISMNSLIKAFGTIPPFEKIICDIRHSLGYQISVKIGTFKKEEKEELGSQIGYWVTRGAENLFQKKEGERILKELSPSEICFYGNGQIYLSCLNVLNISGGKKKRNL